MFSCLTGEDSKYHMLNNKCYFFEKTRVTWEKAKEGCKNKFPAGGKLFEPMTLAENKLVYNVAKPIFNLQTYGAWIGVTDASQEGSFNYDSNDSPVSFNIPWYGVPYGGTWNGKGGTSKNCILVHEDPGKWMDNDCSYSCYSICEPNV